MGTSKVEKIIVEVKGNTIIVFDKPEETRVTLVVDGTNVMLYEGKHCD